MDVERKHASLAVHIEECRSAAAGKAPHGAFNNPMLSEQFLDDQGHCASLQARDAGQIGTRDGLPGADLIEDEVAIDLAWYFVRRTDFISK
jgi:hypothetical protein